MDWTEQDVVVGAEEGDQCVTIRGIGRRLDPMPTCADDLADVEPRCCFVRPPHR